MSRPRPSAVLRSDLRAMSGDAMAFSFMVGVGESYLPAFALALGLGDVTAGLVATVPMMAGAVLQLVSPAAVGWLGSHKRWVVLCASLQAASFAPLVTAALAEEIDPVLLYATVALYWGLGMATGPAWNTWVGDLVPRPLRARYFARRSRLAHVAVLAGLASGGVLLDLGTSRGEPLRIYALVFGFALVSRSISAWLLGTQSEPRPVPLGDTRISPPAIRHHLRTGGHGPLLAYLLCFQLAVWIAAPYFTPYMLGPLGLDYTQFMLLTGAAFLARILSLPALGHWIQLSGTRRVLWIGSLGIVPLPALWMVSDAFAWLVALQLLSGVAWASVELATLLAFFEHIPRESRTSVLSVYNVAYAAAIVGGGWLGGWILHTGAGGSGNGGAYFALMVVSALARMACLPLLTLLSDVTPATAQPPVLRTLSVRPSAGALERPVLPTLDADGDAGAPDADADESPARAEPVGPGHAGETSR